MGPMTIRGVGWGNRQMRPVTGSTVFYSELQQEFQLGFKDNFLILGEYRARIHAAELLWEIRGRPEERITWKKLGAPDIVELDAEPDPDDDAPLMRPDAPAAPAAPAAPVAPAAPAAPAAPIAPAAPVAPVPRDDSPLTVLFSSAPKTKRRQAPAAPAPVKKYNLRSREDRAERRERAPVYEIEPSSVTPDKEQVQEVNGASPLAVWGLQRLIGPSAPPGEYTCAVCCALLRPMAATAKADLLREKLACDSCGRFGRGIPARDFLAPCLAR
ncbi:unnamed protein product [Symbiodinium natans]|uniref:Uncharacterized protein n=1 Tax=Symbiodinium natans TaxID=878477 RepID=A0A812M7V5_9DINO|nr:unnamed protein product [Symbiodinium natans]